MKKVFVASLLMIAVVLVPACRTKKTPAPVTTATVADTAPPDVAPPPVDTATPVAPREDFVQDEPMPRDVVPSDIEELNRWVQSKGYVRDAFFNYDEASLDEAAQANLTASASWLKSADGAGYRLLVEGHCDERGTEQYNLALGDRRANAAKDYLVTLGVDAGRIRTVSYGEERPFEEGHDDASWSQNRRAHLVLVR